MQFLNEAVAKETQEKPASYAHNNCNLRTLCQFKLKIRGENGEIQERLFKLEGGKSQECSLALAETVQSGQQGAWLSEMVCEEFIVLTKKLLDGEGGKSSSLLEVEKEREGTETFLNEQESDVQHLVFRREKEACKEISLE